MKFCRILSLIAAALLAIGANGAVNVTASRDYVDRKVYALQTNIEDRINHVQPGNYLAVSNNAMNALSRDEAKAGITKWSWRSTGPSIVSIEWRSGEWVGVQADSGTTIHFDPPYNADTNATHLTSNDVTADRTRLPTMKDVEDKASTNDVSTIVTNRTTGVMSGARVFPLARYDYFNDYTCDVGDVVEKDGRLYRCISSDFGDGQYPWFPVDNTHFFEDVTDLFSTNAIVRMYQLSTIDMSSKQDLLPYPTNAIPYSAVNGTPTKLSQFQNDSGFITSSTAPVKTVNSKSGNVTLDALDVGAIPQTGMVVNVTSGTMHFSPRLSVGVWPSGYKPINISGGSGAAFTFGDMVHTEGANTMALGTGVLNTNAWSFIWSGDATRYYSPSVPSMNNPYSTRYNGGFHVNPSVRTGMTNPLQNFWIGDTNLNDWIGFLAPAPDLSGYLPKSGGDMTGGLTIHGAGIELTTLSGILGGNYLKITKDGIETGANGTPNPFVFSFPEESGTLALSSEIPDVSKYLDIKRFDEWTTNSNVIIGRSNITNESSDGVLIIGHDNVATNTDAVALGTHAVAGGVHSTAIGTSEAYGLYSQAFGFDNFAYGQESFAAGLFSRAHDTYSIAMGYGAVSTNVGACAIGVIPEASGYLSTAIGYQANASETAGIAIGPLSIASHTNTVAIGNSAKATNIWGVAIGTSAEAGAGGVAIGYFSRAPNGGVAMGIGRRRELLFSMSGASALGTRGVALGGFVDTNATDSVSIGTYGWVTNKNAVVIAACTGEVVNGPEVGSKGDGTINLCVTNGLQGVFLGTNRLDNAVGGHVSEVVTQSYIQQKLGVYLYIGEDGGVYVHTPTNQEEEQ